MTVGRWVSLFFANRRDFFRRFMLVFLLTSFLVLPFQNCASGIFSTVKFSRQKTTRAGLSSGNGDSYDGKPQPGDYIRRVPEYKCGSDAGTLTVTSTEARLELKQETDCTTVTTDLVFNDLNFSPYNNDFLGYKDGLYERIYQNPAPYQTVAPEALCRWQNGPMEGLDVVIRFEESKAVIASMILGQQQADGSFQSRLIRPFAIDRKLQSGGLHYHSPSHAFDLRVDLATNSVLPAGVFNGKLEAVIDDVTWQKDMNCQMATDLDVLAYHFIYAQVPIVLPTGSPINDIIPVTTSSFASFSISPALPAGLNLNSQTGVISGSPTAYTPKTNYVVTAVTSLGLNRTASLSFATGAHFLVDSFGVLGDGNLGDQICGGGPGQCTLRAALEEAANSFPNSLTFIEIPAGVISTSGFEYKITSPVYIKGAGKLLTVVDGAFSSRIFKIESDSEVVIEDLTVQNGNSSDDGGAIVYNPLSYSPNGNAVLHLRSVAVLNSRTPVVSTNFGGGGLYFKGRELYLEDCDFVGNQGPINGGGNAGGGGVLSEASSTAVIDGCLFEDNHAFYGGGLAAEMRGAVVKRSIFRNNTAVMGGGLYFGGSANTVQIESTLIENNISTSLGGGGLYLRPSGTDDVLIMNTAIVGNNNASLVPGGSGGGVYAGMTQFFGKKIKFINSTISGNSATDGGGVFFETFTNIEFVNSILSQNISTMTSHSNCSWMRSQDPTYDAKISSLGANIESQNSCGFDQSTDFPNTDPVLGAGPDMASSIMPLTGSPAIGGATSSYCSWRDQIGSLRFSEMDFQARCDIGAVESR